MPHEIACPRCSRNGFIRLEVVIQGGDVSRAYYCGSCDHNWTVPDGWPDDTSPFPQPRKSKTRHGPKQL